MFDFQTLWYLVIIVATFMYVALDGFDLGVGCLHLFARTDTQRRIFLNSIGPVWDGNEVWLIIVIGGTFAGFPNVYASALSGFYTPLMALLAALVFRAVAIEFRSKRESKGWRSLWDVTFSIASIVIALLIGVMLGNLVKGVALNAAQDYTGTFLDLITPYTLTTGVLAGSLFAMHGAIYLYMKTEGETHAVVRRWILPAIGVFVVCFLATTIQTLLFMPERLTPFYNYPALWAIPLAAVIMMANIVYQVHKQNAGWAFISSCLCMIFLLCLFAIGHYPNLIISTVDPAHNSLTIYNTCSTHKTLGVLLTIAGIGVPLVLAYGLWVYRVFRGKVRLDHTSY